MQINICWRGSKSRLSWRKNNLDIEQAVGHRFTRWRLLVSIISFQFNLNQTFLDTTCLYQTCLWNFYPTNLDYFKIISMTLTFPLTLCLSYIFKLISIKPPYIKFIPNKLMYLYQTSIYQTCQLYPNSIHPFFLYETSHHQIERYAIMLNSTMFISIKHKSIQLLSSKLSSIKLSASICSPSNFCVMSFCHICALSSAISQVWHTPFCTQPSLSNLSSFLHHRKVNMRAFRSFHAAFVFTSALEVGLCRLQQSFSWVSTLLGKDSKQWNPCDKRADDLPIR